MTIQLDKDVNAASTSVSFDMLKFVELQCESIKNSVNYAYPSSNNRNFYAQNAHAALQMVLEGAESLLNAVKAMR